MATSERTMIVPEVQTNLRMMEPSRKKLRAGDVFVIQLPDQRYLFGRVISTEAVVGPIRDCILIYVFRLSTESKESPDRTALRPNNLLVPPIIINRLPWSRGYFHTVAYWPLAPEEVLKRHCFFSVARNRYFDEKGNELPGPIEPVGRAGLASYRVVDDDISDALGIPRVPELG